MTEVEERRQRKRLPDLRGGLTHKFILGAADDPERLRGYLTVNVFPDTGQPGELFLKLHNVGSLAHGMAEALAIMVSVALQHGVPLSKVVEKLKGHRFAPYGLTGAREPELRQVNSVLDYIGRWLELKFLQEKQQ